MFDAITPTAIMDTATAFATALATPLLVVVGFGVVFAVANWISNKIGRR